MGINATPDDAPPLAPAASLAGALFTQTQQRVLGLVFGQPQRRFTVTELIALTGAGSGAVQRELAKLADSGLVTVQPLGNQKLYQAIRTKLLKDGHVDTVIGLPANLFYSTGIPVCILVLKRCKQSDDVLFINAAEHFEKGKRQNRLLPKHIDKIVDTYRYRREESRYSRRVEMAEIVEKHDFNLNISRYVSTAQAEQEIDLKAVHADLVQIEKEVSDARRRHNAFLKELGLLPLPEPGKQAR